jgi:DNA-binding ferritin-like protein
MKELQSADDVVRELAHDHEQISRTLRDTAGIANEFKDKASAQMLTGRRMLRSLVA